MAKKNKSKAPAAAEQKKSESFGTCLGDIINAAMKKKQVVEEVNKQWKKA